MTTNSPYSPLPQATCTEEQKRAIRDLLAHGDGSRRVRIHRDGRITYYGSSDPVDRSHDYWHDGGTVADALAEIRARSEGGA